jgi:hypothetical protein
LVKDGRDPVALCHAFQPECIQTLMKRVGARVLILEQQYVTDLKRARTILELTFQMGIGIGWVACMRPFSGTHVFHVAPSTWQAHQKKLAGILKGPQLKRAEALEMAMGRAKQVLGNDPEWKAAKKASKEGIASAFGIGEWWLDR